MIKERKIIDIILPCHFFGSVNTYAFYFIGNIKWEAHENFQKRSMRNRCSFKTAVGEKQFSVPLKAGKNQQLPIRDVKISYSENWVKNFAHYLITNYSASPYLDYYIAGFIQILSKKHDHLWDLNWELNQLIIDLLDIDISIEKTDDWIRSYGESAIDLRYNSMTIDHNYQYPQLFKEKGIDFIDNLSILDLLFCCGPEAQIHLQNIADQIMDKNYM